jgi:hypothetical protein
LRATGRIEDLEANVGRAIHLLAAERLRFFETVEEQTVGIFHHCEPPPVGIARRAGVDRLCEGDELAGLDDLSPAVRRAGAIVEAQVHHVSLLALRCWLLAFGSVHIN